MKRINLILGIVFVTLLASCSGSDYINVIPSGSQAVVSFDMVGLSKSAKLSDSKKSEALKALLHIDDPSECGIDISRKVYLFESPDGSLGLVAKVGDDGDMEDYFNKIAGNGICTKVTKEKGFHWTVLHGSWIVGFSSEAVLVMGPAVGGAQQELRRTMAQYLDEDEDESVKGTPLFDKLDGLQGDVTMVASTAALPEKFVVPFRLGAPQDADPEDVMIAASMQMTDKCLNIEGTTFSFKSSVDKALKDAAKSYLPIKGVYANSIPDNAVAAVMTSFDGQQFIKLLRSDKGLRAMLIGLNTALDVDQMIKSIKGDATLVIPSTKNTNLDYMFAARLTTKAFLNDVGYWKQSLPEGATLTDNGKDSYHFSNKDWNMFFGVRDNNLVVGSNEGLYSCTGRPVSRPLSSGIIDKVKGKKLCIIVNIDALAQQKPAVKTVTDILKPVFGNINAITYSIK